MPRPFRDWSLWTKIVVLLAFASMFPLATSTYVGTIRGIEAVEVQTHEALVSRADALAATLDAFHRAYLGDAIQLSRLPAMLEECTGGPGASGERTSRALRAFDDPNVMWSSLVAADGTILESNASQLLGANVSYRPWFREARSGAPYVSDVIFPIAPLPPVPIVVYSSPVVDGAGEVQCVIVLSVRAAGFSDAVRKANGFAGEGSYAVVLDGWGVRIAHSFRDDDLFRPAGPLPPDEIARFDAEKRFGPDTRRLLEHPLDAPAQFERARAARLGDDDAMFHHWARSNAQQNLAVARRLQTVPWTLFVLVPEATIEAPARRVGRDAALLGGLFVVLAFVVGLGLARGILGPVRAVAAAADRVAGGDLAVRVFEGGDEVGRLGARFNAMTEAIQRGQADLEQKVEARTTDLVAANRELEAQRTELEAQARELRAQQRELELKSEEVVRANRLKSEFVANMSHELRTPLNSVIGFTDLVLDGAGTGLSEAHRTQLGHVLTSAKHLLALINGILDLSKIEAGQATLTLEPLAPADALNDALGLIRSQALKRRILLRSDVRTERRLHADRAKLRQVMLNLLSNAVKFSPEGSSVTVSAEDAGAFIRLSVADEGPGIEASLVPHLFEPFVQGESTFVKRHQGTGLGLAISKRIVEMHGGRLQYEPREGGGAVFQLTLPQAAVESPRWLSRPPAGTARDAAEHGAAPSPPPEPPHAVPARVLVVEDEPHAASLLRSLLEPAGYVVNVAEGIGAALTAVREAPPDVVILDLNLADAPASEVVDRIVADGCGCDAPIVVLSAADADGALRARLAGHVHAVAQKGDLTREELLNTLARAMDARPSLRGHEASDRTVVVVDDHDLNRELARDLLERAGCHVIEARDADEALAVVRRERPALVLMDLGLPGKDGIAAACELKADPATAKIPIVALTAHAMRGHQERTQQAGMDGYLTKPIDRATLQAVVDRFVPRRA